MKRRRILAGLAAAALSSGVARADAPVPVTLTLLVGGPDGQQASRWADASALAMQAGFPGAPGILPRAVGGLDGVTAANQLDALVVPDGRTAAILPGAALIAWLTGDPRVHFDPTRWEPVLGGCNSGVLVARLPAGGAPDLTTLQAMAPMRLAADEPQSNDLAALLAMARLNVPAAPVFGLRGRGTKLRAFAAGEVDAVFLCGEGVPEDVAPLVAAGGVPVFCLGNMGPGGAVGPDPLFPGLPDVISFGGHETPFLDSAYRAAAAAARLDFVMVLPRLSDPGAVAQWRQGGSAAIAAPAMAAAARASAVTLVGAPEAAASLAALNLVAADQTSLQAYLVKSFGWQPG